MNFTPTAVAGAWIVDLDPRSDERGFFSRAFSRDEFEAYGMNPHVAQANVAFSIRAGTLRGLHYQAEPHQEAKLIRCTAGRIFDVVADVRPESATFRRWAGVELSAANRRMFYVPEGCAHGYLTLEDGSELFYMVSSPYAPSAERGVRWDDPVFGIEWPLDPRCMHARDRAYPDFTV